MPVQRDHVHPPPIGEREFGNGRTAQILEQAGDAPRQPVRQADLRLAARVAASGEGDKIGMRGL